MRAASQCQQPGRGKQCALGDTEADDRVLSLQTSVSVHDRFAEYTKASCSEKVEREGQFRALHLVQPEQISSLTNQFLRNGCFCLQKIPDDDGLQGPLPGQGQSTCLAVKLPEQELSVPISPCTLESRAMGCLDASSVAMQESFKDLGWDFQLCKTAVQFVFDPTC